MRLTESQLRRIIKQEIYRSALNEALDPNKLAKMSESEIFKTMVQVTEQFKNISEQAQSALKDKAGDAAVLAAQMKNVDYAMEGLNACVEALKSKSKAQ